MAVHNCQVAGFHYSRKGEQISRTPREWQSLLSTHTRRVDRSLGETFFINKTTRRIEYEAYAIIPAV